jgi:hypothetical protein
MNMQVAVLTGQVEVVKRLLRYVRREHTIKRNKLVEMITNHQQGAIYYNVQGDARTFEQFIKLYEKILKEYEQALEEAKKRDTNEDPT